MSEKVYVRVGKPSFPVEKRAIDLLDIWVRNSKIDNIGSVLGRPFVIDYDIDGEFLIISTGGQTLNRFRRALKTRKRLDMVMVGNSCKQKYSSINIQVQIESIELDTQTTIRWIEPIIIQPDNTLLELPKMDTYQVKLKPLVWIFDEFLGTTANDPQVIRGNLNIQYRIEYKKGEIKTKYLGFSCDDRYKPGIFLYGCPI